MCVVTGQVYALGSGAILSEVRESRDGFVAAPSYAQCDLVLGYSRFTDLNYLGCVLL